MKDDISLGGEIWSSNMRVSWGEGYVKFDGIEEMSDLEIREWRDRWNRSGQGFMTFCSNNNLNATSFWNGLGKLDLPRP